ncbi:hypothetical protein L484_011728 [Morus notabilis]|uniref:Uncharacterized protein n=1 Tax=Morus notabilis TaxID=981085 RepID=W9RUD4_9ROSA|nr:hypothetical protein L484_011728 [Morus notabilis]
MPKTTRRIKSGCRMDSTPGEGDSRSNGEKGRKNGEIGSVRERKEGIKEKQRESQREREESSIWRPPGKYRGAATKWEETKVLVL